MRTRAGLRAAAFLALLLGALPCFADRASDLFDEGTRSFSGAQYREAARSFQRVVTDFPGSTSAEDSGYLLGVSLFYSAQWNEAVAALSSFRSRFPRSALAPRASYWMGAASLKLGRYAAALGYLGGLDPVGLGSFGPSSQLLAGAALEGLGRDAEAADRYRSVLADPSAAKAVASEARFRLAGTEMRAGRISAARDLYGRIILETPDSTWVSDSLFYAAECDLALGDPTDAARRYRTLLAVYPDSPWREAAAFRIALASWQIGDPGAAAPLVDLYLQQFPEGKYSAEAWRLRGDISRESGGYAQAADDYARAAARTSGGARRQEIQYAQAVALLAAGRSRDAADTFGRAARQAPGDAAEAALFQQAAILAGAGSTGEAAAVLVAALRDYPDGAHAEEMLRMLATLRESAGDEAAAAAAWSQLVSRFPGSPDLPEALFRRAGLSLHRGDLAAAMVDYQRIADDFPSSPLKGDSLYALGYAYALRGEYPRALPYFQEASRSATAPETRERASLSVAVSLFNMGSFASAAAAFQDLLGRGVTVVPRGTVVLSLGRALYRQERLGEAADTFREAASLLGASGSPEAEDATWLLAWSTLRLGRIVEARDAFLSVARQGPSGPRAQEALFRAGVCETLRFDDAAAVGLFDSALAATPAGGGGRSDAATEAGGIREQILYEKAGALSRLQQPAQSMAVLDQLSREFPNGALAPSAWYKLAESELADRKYDEARAAFRRVASDFPRSAEAIPALYGEAEAALGSGDARGALEGFWSSISAGAGSGLREAAVDGFRQAMLAADSSDLARQYADRASAASDMPGDTAAGILLACAEVLLPKDAAGSLALIDRVRRASPQEPWAGRASLLIGKYRAATGDRSGALAVFTALAGSRSDEVGALAAEAQGLVLEGLGRTAEAVDVLATLYRRFPGFDEIGARSLAEARRIALSRGDTDKAGSIAETLRTAFPQSRWLKGEADR
jgi:TolA-binding protein